LFFLPPMHPKPSPARVRHRRTAVRVALVALIAALVPVVWAAVVLERSADAPIVLAMVATSVAFWSSVAGWLYGARLGWAALPAALAIGALSPILCAVLWELLLLPLWPFLLLTAGHALVVPFAIFGLLAVAWPAFVPVGAGMGLVVFLLTRQPCASRTARA
jgi:hypothetical protein